MIRKVGAWLGAIVVLTSVPAFAQASGPGRVEITAIPAGGTFYTSKGSNPDFGNYTYGGAFAVNFNRFVGIEGEVAGSAGVAQDLNFSSGTTNVKTPNTVSYSGNVVFSAANGGSLVPFVTGGVGGLTLFQRAELGVNENDTFLSGNIGGGLKWYASNGKWGLRGDYRFIAVKSKDDAPAFFGQDTRYGHRVYLGLVINPLQ